MLAAFPRRLCTVSAAARAAAALPLRAGIRTAQPALIRRAVHVSAGHGPSPHGSNNEPSGNEQSSSILGKVALIAALIALGPAYSYLSSSSPKSEQKKAPAAPEEPQIEKPSKQTKTKIPSRSSARSDKPKPIRDVPFVPYILVGGGTASYSAMEAIREAQPDAQILIVSEEEFPPYQRPPLSKELWFTEKTTDDLRFKDWQGNESSLFYRPTDFFNVVDAENLSKLDSAAGKTHLLTNARVININPEDQTVQLANGSRVQYGRLLIATGGTPKTIQAFEKIPESIQSRVMTFRGVDDFKRLESVAKRDTKIAVIGGGFLGSELSVAIAARQGVEPGLQVVQIFPEDGNMGLVFPRYLTKWTTETLRKSGIDVKTNVEIEDIGEADGKVELHTKDGSKIVVDYAVMAVGLAPNEELAKKSGLEIDPVRGGIMVNAELEARTHVFAAGDISSFHDIALGRRRVEHYDHAVMSGRIAGFNMTGAKRPYTHQSMFWSDLGPHISYQAVGIIDSKLPTLSVWAKKTDKSDSVDSKVPEEFNKGVVFYLTPSHEIAGVLMWNLFGKMDLARKILRDKKKHTDVESLAKEFDLHA